MKKNLYRMIIVLMFFLFSGSAVLLHAKTLIKNEHGRPEIETTIKDRKSIFVTIYNQDIALIKEKRSLAFPEGESLLEFKDVSGKMIPETALLKASNLKVIEQNFEFDLLTPSSLLKKFTGRDIKIVKTNSATGEEKILGAKVLSTVDGVVLKLDNGIETGIPGRIIFPYIPDNLRTSPTLTMLVKTRSRQNRQNHDLELSYLTHGLTWRADYVAKLNTSDTALALSGWVTLTNTSRANYNNARLQLVAGDINIAAPEKIMTCMRTFKTAVRKVADNAFSREQLFEYHLYTLNRKTDIKNNQTKQVVLIHSENIPCKKEFILADQDDSYYYTHQYDNLGVRLKIAVYLDFKNSRENNLGIPVPKGIIRVYKEDTKGNIQFAGEDRIDHTPENAVIRLKLGNAFDITAEKRQTEFIKLNSTSYNSYKYQSSCEIKIMNSKNKSISVKVLEPVHGQWRIKKENFSHYKPDADHAEWNIPVPAKGVTLLKYTIQTK